ncbi:copper-translocating P-type ATPase [Vibrio astriarenae]|nr:copper-translocating P-type ATPase [Vibrio sp. C7]
MDTLVSLGTGAAWLYSMLVVIAPAIFLSKQGTSTSKLAP